MSKDIRLRIAPSPTGEPHVGTAYIALMNLCYAKKNKGKFILRIEDTDQKRSTKESENNIYESLKWLGLNWDEGPDIGGDYGPYRQSERLEIYQEKINILLENGLAYRCFCSAVDLAEIRQKQKESKDSRQGYFGDLSPCRKLSREESEKRAGQGEPFVIRMAVPADMEEVVFTDMIRKQSISKKCFNIDDQVLIKSDGFPTYHFASVVDDHMMKISHVFRGEEWINSTYKHILLYNFFGWEAPEFFHLGLLRNPDANKSKISKRKNPVSLRWFRAAGYTKDALVNFLGLMGYSRYKENMSDEEKKSWEYFTLADIISDFDTGKLSSTGPAFDFTKLEDMNFNYISKLSVDEYYEYLINRLRYLKEYLSDINPMLHERYLRAEKDINYWTAFLFRDPLNYRLEDFRKVKFPSFSDGAALLKSFKKALGKKVEEITNHDELTDFIKAFIAESGVKSKLLHMSLRIAVTGSLESLPLYDAMLMLGLYRVMKRCDDAAQFLAKNKE